MTEPIEPADPVAPEEQPEQAGEVTAASVPLGYGAPSGNVTGQFPPDPNHDGFEPPAVGEPSDQRKVKKGVPVPDVTELEASPVHPLAEEF